MVMIFSDENGVRNEGIILSASESHIRLAVRGNDDTVEFRRTYRRWVSETGQQIDIEALLPESTQDAAFKPSPPVQAHAVAAGACEYWIG